MDIELLFKRFFSCFYSVFFGWIDMLGRDLSQMIGIENWFKFFAKRTQKNAIVVGKCIPAARKIGNFERLKYDKTKSFSAFHQKIIPVTISQTGSIGRNLTAGRASGRRRGATGGKKQNKNNDSGTDGDGGEPPLREQLVDLTFLSGFLGLKKQTIKNRLAAHPDSLPPPIYLPLTRGPRWFYEDVISWARQFREGGRP